MFRAIYAMFTSCCSSDGDKLYELAFAQAKVSVCHVQAPPIPPDTAVLQGTADLYELAGGVFTVATNNHVIPITDANFLVNTEFTFEGVEQIRLSKEEMKFCTTNKELDATVIELTEAGVKRLQQLGAKFTRVTTANGGDKSPEGEFCIDRGAIHEIKDKEVYYYLGGALGSNGSPILLWNYRAIGMHKQSGTSIEHSALVPIRHVSLDRLLAIAVLQLAVLRYTRKIVNRATTSIHAFLENPNYAMLCYLSIRDANSELFCSAELTSIAIV